MSRLLGVAAQATPPVVADQMVENRLVVGAETREEDQVVAALEDVDRVDLDGPAMTLRMAAEPTDAGREPDRPAAAMAIRRAEARLSFLGMATIVCPLSTASGWATFPARGRPRVEP